ncbi:DUF202 domain-containing protein [Streptomyces sp. SAJ15]|uniref:DUF202 domain-containing protein n=1 Tax=Streptomyces sp. SAJ15 TaxID=2011095 RepID=UPI001186CB1A|nr:DUF202 domain-containing protein [Streptomyces sp. SAJ15]TVL90560.1 hypothetical protein CD790_21610 [Streptomyces sp. SAJ15]
MPSGRPRVERDPGLQPERTRLAWRRTTLACAVVCVLAERQAVREGPPDAPRLLAVALIAFVWLLFLAVAHLRIQALDAPRPPALSPRAAVAASGCTLAIAALGVVLLC